MCNRETVTRARREYRQALNRLDHDEMLAYGAEIAYDNLQDFFRLTYGEQVMNAVFAYGWPVKPEYQWLTGVGPQCLFNNDIPF